VIAPGDTDHGKKGASRITRTAVVTGANRGIGLEVCRQLVGGGFATILTARDPERGLLAAKNAGVDFQQLDVASEHSVHAAISEIARRHTRIDVLVNNAAVHYDSWQSAADADLDIVQEALETNLLGAWRTSLATVPLMRQNGWGRIVNISSQGGSLASMGGGTPAYSVSKAGLNAFTRILASELAGTGILVNSVCPGWVATDMGGPGGRPVEAGAASVMWAILLEDDGPTGGFYRDGKPLPW